jgi:hypothetical protein
MFINNPIDRNKLSPEFATRLDRLAPHEKVRVIVLLNIRSIEQPAGKRQSRLERQAAIKSIRDSATQGLANINEIIQHCEAKLLVDRPDALGAVAMEITSIGIEALIKSDVVKAVMEDRSIYAVAND